MKQILIIHISLTHISTPEHPIFNLKQSCVPLWVIMAGRENNYFKDWMIWSRDIGCSEAGVHGAIILQI